MNYNLELLVGTIFLDEIVFNFSPEISYKLKVDHTLATLINKLENEVSTKIDQALSNPNARLFY